MLVIIQKAWNLVTADFERYHKHWREFHPNTEPPKPFCSGFTFVDESADRAEELARKYLAANYRTALEHYEMLGKHFDKHQGLRALFGHEQVPQRNRPGQGRRELHPAHGLGNSAAGPRKIRGLQKADRHAGHHAQPQFRRHAPRRGAAQHRLLRKTLHARTEELAFRDTRRAEGTRPDRGVARVTPTATPRPAPPGRANLYRASGACPPRRVQRAALAGEYRRRTCCETRSVAAARAVEYMLLEE